jgi:hypothetical protein
VRNIQHGDFQNHTQNCPNWVIPCTAADIRCAWQGMRAQLDNHVRVCPFQQIRPIVDDLRGQIQSHSRQINDLQNKQFFFIMLVIFSIFLVLMSSSPEQNRQPRSFGEKFRGLFEN